MASEPEYTYNFAIITGKQRSKGEMGLQSKMRIHDLDDSVRHHRLSNIQDGGQ